MRDANYIKVVIFQSTDLGKPGVGGPGSSTSEGVLANFFNSLLSKKTAGGQPGSPGSPGTQLKAAGPDDCEYF